MQIHGLCEHYKKHLNLKKLLLRFTTIFVRVCWSQKCGDCKLNKPSLFFFIITNYDLLKKLRHDLLTCCMLFIATKKNVHYQRVHDKNVICFAIFNKLIFNNGTLVSNVTKSLMKLTKYT